MPELLEAEVLTLNKAFEMQETVFELFENLGCAMTVACSVVLRVDWVNNNENSLALGSLGVERPTTSKYKIFA